MEKLKKLFAKVFEVDPNSINDDSSPDNLENWDSLKFMQLIAEFESEYNLNLNINTIMKLKKFSDFKDLIEIKP